MTNRAALIDFSGTLFRLDYTPEMLTRMLGDDLDGDRKTALLRRLTAPTGRPEVLTEAHYDDWARRDLDAAAHRRANVAMLQGHGLEADAADRFYDGMVVAESWHAYPDTERALRTLRERGIKVAVVSNIAWDIRPMFERAGVYDLVDEYVLSFEVGIVKPDPKIFLTACERLGVEPTEAVMIGDSAEADGAATAIGCAFRKVEPVPAEQRPDSLVTIVDAEFAR